MSSHTSPDAAASFAAHEASTHGSHADNPLIQERRAKLQALRERAAASGQAVFPNDVKPTHQAAALHAEFSETDAVALEEQKRGVTVAGRMMLKRVMGKAAFATVQDASGQIQLYIARDSVGEEALADFKHWDLGDIVACTGHLFRTRTGELSVHATSLRLLTKNLRPLPDKFHGVHDAELKVRQRYVDLITDSDTRERFRRRSATLAAIRQFMLQHEFLEVETPMLHPIPGGANARPFVTHHNALDQAMFLRIAPELYLKRLVVGGFERVFEINRNFRNEGVSVRHNPEFTMMEFYASYWTHRDMMDFTEQILRHAAQAVCGTAQLSYQGRPVDLSQPFARLTIAQAVRQYAGVSDEQATDADHLRQRLQSRGVTAMAHWGLPELQFALFEEVVEEQLWQPTFIMDHPVAVSPLARASDADPGVTERFELYITGREIANAFSELNDAEEQARRFNQQAQAKDAGDEEAMYYDADFIRALEYGMPPTAGCGIGLDRLVMLLTDAASIRDIILFPALRHEA
ncbi:lysine--tRNA ligase [Amphibiibacter pelophylacis]|uniref:Lysine--tRNA ligase n=1 Tax=Amphibiibacter pelophylacis TaxID=1799477 RepID=A0ACC6P059_9BURK